MRLWHWLCRFCAVLITSCVLLASAAAQDTPKKGQISGLIGAIQIRTAIDVASLAPGRVHRFYVPAGRMPSGQDWLVPVVVIRGVEDGPKLMVTAAIHGDELNGIGVAHRLIAEVTPEALAGTLTVLPSINIPGIIARTRYYPAATYNGAGVNLNREMPGSPSNVEAGARYAHALWRGALQGNADFVVDVHTQSTGTSYPMFVFADFREDGVEEMAKLLGPDVIKIDPGQKGSIETAYNDVGVPSVTLELGAANSFDYALIDRAVAGIKRLMSARDMLPGTDVPAAEKAPIIGNDTVGVQATVTGVVMRSVKLLDTVKKGDEVAVSTDAFGRIVKRYTAPVGGTVVVVSTDPMRDAGALIIRILTTNKRRSCRNGC